MLSRSIDRGGTATSNSDCRHYGFSQTTSMDDYVNIFTYRGGESQQYTAGYGGSICSGDCVDVSFDDCKAMCTAQSKCRIFNWGDETLNSGKQCCTKECSDASGAVLAPKSGQRSKGWDVYLRKRFGDTSYSYSQIDVRMKCPIGDRPNCSDGSYSCNFQSADGCFSECLAADGCTHFSFSLKGSKLQKDGLGLCILCTKIPSQFFDDSSTEKYPDAISYEMVTTTVTASTTTSSTSTTSTPTSSTSTTTNKAKATGAPLRTSGSSEPGSKTYADSDGGSDGDSTEPENAGNADGGTADLENSPSRSSVGGLVAGILVLLVLVAVVSAVVCMRKKEQARQRALTNAAALRRRGARQQNAGYVGGGGGGGGGNAGGGGNVDDGTCGNVDEDAYGNDSAYAAIDTAANDNVIATTTTGGGGKHLYGDDSSAYDGVGRSSSGISTASYAEPYETQPARYDGLSYARLDTDRSTYASSA